MRFSAGHPCLRLGPPGSPNLSAGPPAPHLSCLGGPLAEALDLPARVHDSLRPGEERVAHGADLGLELFASRARPERVSTHAGDERVFVVGGVNGYFHGLTPREVY